MKSSPVILALILLAAAAPGADAQRVTDLPPGTRVRVWTSTGGTVTGGVRETTPDALVLTPEGTTVAASIPREEVHRIDVSMGPESRSTRALRWGSRGFLASAALFTALCAGGGCADEGDGGGDLFSVALTGGISGGLWGAILGALTQGEAWRTLSATGARVEIERRGAARVGLSIER